MNKPQYTVLRDNLTTPLRRRTPDEQMSYLNPEGHGAPKNDHEYIVFKKTIWGETSGELLAGQAAVAHVIKNRVDDRNGEFRNFRTFTDVVRQPGKQFECWWDRDGNLLDDIQITHSQAMYDRLDKWLPGIYHGGPDRVAGCKHFNNPAKEGYPTWTQRAVGTEVMKHHTFYWF